MDKEFFIKQLDGVLSEFNIILEKSQYTDLSDIRVEHLANIATKAKATVGRVVGKNSDYYEDILIYSSSNESAGVKIRAIIGVIKALRSDLIKDYLMTFSELIHSSMFSDFIEMSEYLVSENYKDASAVIIGSALEVHLRNLCKKNNIKLNLETGKGKIIPKKADAMNSDLARKEVYNKIIQKQITSWLAIRNSAAHGNYSEYTLEDVRLMIHGIKHFIINNSA